MFGPDMKNKMADITLLHFPILLKLRQKQKSCVTLISLLLLDDFGYLLFYWVFSSNSCNLWHRLVVWFILFFKFMHHRTPTGRLRVVLMLSSCRSPPPIFSSSDCNKIFFVWARTKDLLLALCWFRGEFKISMWKKNGRCRLILNFFTLIFFVDHAKSMWKNTFSKMGAGRRGLVETFHIDILIPSQWHHVLFMICM